MYDGRMQIARLTPFNLLTVRRRAQYIVTNSNLCRGHSIANSMQTRARDVTDGRTDR